MYIINLRFQLLEGLKRESKFFLQYTLHEPCAWKMLESFTQSLAANSATPKKALSSSKAKKPWDSQHWISQVTSNRLVWGACNIPHPKRAQPSRRTKNPKIPQHWKSQVTSNRLVWGACNIPHPKRAQPSRRTKKPQDSPALKSTSDIKPARVRSLQHPHPMGTETRTGWNEHGQKHPAVSLSLVKTCKNC